MTLSLATRERACLQIAAARHPYNTGVGVTKGLTLVEGFAFSTNVDCDFAAYAIAFACVARLVLRRSGLPGHGVLYRNADNVAPDASALFRPS
jgi:hypothetical protein